MRVFHNCSFETLKMTNVLILKGSLPARRQTFLESIDRYQAMEPIERAHFLFNRYCHGGYLDFIRAWGRDDNRLKGKIQEAEKSLERKAPDALEKVERAGFAIKSKGIP